MGWWSAPAGCRERAPRRIVLQSLCRGAMHGLTLALLLLLLLLYLAMVPARYHRHGVQQPTSKLQAEQSKHVLSADDSRLLTEGFPSSAHSHWFSVRKLRRGINNAAVCMAGESLSRPSALQLTRLAPQATRSSSWEDSGSVVEASSPEGINLR